MTLFDLLRWWPLLIAGAAIFDAVCWAIIGLVVWRRRKRHAR
jgi:hypothetical protein